jgi:hypothetical protein
MFENFDNTYITDNSLVNLTELVSLNIIRNNAVINNSIKDLVNLKELIVSNNITDDGLKNLTGLTKLCIAGN